MAKLMLVGMIEPLPGKEAEFDDWYRNNHIEDTANCPAFLSGTLYRKVRDFAGTSPSGYLVTYETDIDDAAEAERLLGEYQTNPAAFPARIPGNASLKIVGAGWYEFDRAYHTRG